MNSLQVNTNSAVTTPQAIFIDSLNYFGKLSVGVFIAKIVHTRKFPDIRYNLLFPLVFSPVDFAIKFSAQKGIKFCPRLAPAIATINNLANSVLFGSSFYAINKYMWTGKNDLVLLSFIAQPLLITLGRELIHYS